jgi:hypothetical protein
MTTKRALKILKAFHQGPTTSSTVKNDALSLAAAFKELINQLQASPGIIMCPDILELCEELKNV